MKNYILKILSIVIFLIAGIFPLSSNAQIVYTDIRDVSLKCRNSKDNCDKMYTLDFNNDGVQDFNLKASTINIGHGCSSCPDYYNSHNVSILPPHFGSLYGYILYQNKPVANANGAAAILDAGTEVNAASNWPSDYSEYPLRTLYSGCSSLNTCFINTFGDWNSNGTHYLGVKFLLSDGIHYGWIRLSVEVAGSLASLTIFDYAYESSPNVAIIAGNNGSSITAKASNNKEIESSDSIKLKLSVVPNPVSASAKIFFTLPKSAKVSFKLYDITGQLIKILAEKEFTEGEQQIVWNAENVGAGVYILKMETSSYSKTQKLIITK